MKVGNFKIDNSRQRMCAIVSACCFAMIGWVTLHAEAAEVHIFGDTSDGVATNVGDVTTNTGFSFVGAAGNVGSRVDASTIFLFELPGTLTSGDILGATLSFSVLQTFDSNDSDGGLTPWNVDLYDLGPRATNQLVAGDYFSGALDGGNDLLEDNVIASGLQINLSDGDPPVRISTDAGSNLSAAVKDAYDAGGAGQFLALRLSRDDPFTGVNDLLERYGIAGSTWETTTNPLTTNRPVLTLNVVPEPSSLALLGLGGLLIARRRRR